MHVCFIVHSPCEAATSVASSGIPPLLASAGDSLYAQSCTLSAGRVASRLLWPLQVSFPLRLCATLLSRWLCFQPLQLVPLKPAADETQSRVSSRCSGRWPPPWTPAVDGTQSRVLNRCSGRRHSERLLSSLCTPSLHLWVCVGRKQLDKQV